MPAGAMPYKKAVTTEVTENTETSLQIFNHPESPDGITG
jgi:DNA/RNA-binding domain of Phe-tRNA-synthetase-like protein